MIDLDLDRTQDRLAPLPNGITLCYRTHPASSGAATGAPVLLIIGMALQLHAWPRSFIQALTQAGHAVTVFDNRDSGCSTQMPYAPPSNLALYLRRVRPQDYDLTDMAEDATLLLDHLGLPAAHVVGMSMGGMIAQTMAARSPGRVLSLTSIFSNTGAAKAGQPRPSIIWQLMLPRARTRDGALRRYLGLMGRLAGPAYPLNREGHAAYFQEAWDRAGARHEGQARQIAAILKSGDRTAALRAIAAPTLVIHGDADPMVTPSGGAATAAAIPGARLVTIPGMGHDLADGVLPRLAALILAHVDAAEHAAPSPAGLA